MIKDETKKFIDELDETKKLPGPRSKNYQEIFSDIRNNTTHLPQSWNLSQRIWYIKSEKLPSCPHCGANTDLSKTLPVRERYCRECVGKSSKVKTKRFNTCMEKYGGKTPTCSKEIAEKVSMSNKGMKRNSHKHYDTLDESLYSKDWLYNQYKIEKVPVYSIADKLGVTPKTVYLHLKKHKISLDSHFRSAGEEKIFEWLSQYSDNIVKNKRLPDIGEIDLYIPELKLGIEFDGLYWHSEEKRSKTYHQDKKIKCMENGIKLISVFEHELYDKFDIIKSSILNHMNIYTSKVRASSCDIRQINHDDSKAFFESNHIQGFSSQKICLGLYHNNVLIYAMSFGKPRFNKKYEWEIIRMCCLKGYKVYGGASKLWKYFIEMYDPKSVISYCNLRYGHGNVYNVLGFEQKNITSPSYFYFNPNKNKNLNNRNKIEILTRYQTQKHKLSNILENYNPNYTESQNMKNSGYLRVYDAGNCVFVFVAK